MNDKNSVEGAQPVFVSDHLTARIYCDGLSQVMLGYPVSRMILHDRVDRDPTNSGAPEVRRVVAEIVMPTINLVALAKHILAGAGQNKDVVLDTSRQQSALLQESIETIELPTGASPSE